MFISKFIVTSWGTMVAAAASSISNATNPVVNLGSAGSYLGVLQNNGTVMSWKGIPYAQPPVGSLRFLPPSPLAAMNSSVIDTTTDALRCVQFAGAPYGEINGNIVGPRSGPGQEDCLKLWVWKPATISTGAKLPVMMYIHLKGGGLQYSAAANNDFSDWVGQSQDFIAVNVGYRLGALGFMAHESLPSANAGLLDQRLALQWIKDNIAVFGGNPDDVTIMGQSGGGYAVVLQMALYDGDAQGLFHRAIPRSIQRSPMFHVKDLAGRNAEYFNLLNCTAGQAQLDCFRGASVPDLVNAYNSLLAYEPTSGLFNNLTFGSSGAFLPMVDGVTLTDTVTKLFQQGKVAPVSVIAGSVNDEGANTLAHNLTSPAANGIWNLTESQIEQALSFYPVNTTFGSTAPDNFFLSYFKSSIMSLSSFGEAGITGSERVVSKAMSKLVGSYRVWSFRFNAPTVGTSYSNSTYPLNYVPHSSDNSYLQNATSVMTDFEKAIAYEWRAYIGSFIRTGNPNTEKLGTSPTWHSYGTLGDYVDTPIRLVSQFAYSSDPNSPATGTQVEVVQRPQIEREDWWTSVSLLDATRL